MSVVIKVLNGDIYSSNADVIVIPMYSISSQNDNIAIKLKEHWRIDFPVPKEMKSGDLLISLVRNANRQDNGNPRNFLVFAPYSMSWEESVESLITILPNLAKLSKENPDIRNIALPMYVQAPSEMDMQYIIESIQRIFFSFADPECGIDLCFLNRQDANYMMGLVAKEMSDSAAKRKLRRKYSSDSNQKKILANNFYVVRGYADRDKEIIDPGTSLIRSDDDAKTEEIFKAVPVGSVVFLSANVASSIDFLPISAIGEVMENNHGKLKVVWFSEGFSSQVKNRGYPLRSIIKIDIEYERKEMYDILKRSSFTEFTNEFMVPDLEQQRRQGRNTDFSNDYEIGDDYLEIGDDVDAFSRIVALRDLRPPLAIALCGRWGAGKSFFMGKMITKMQSLSTSDSGLFCQGMVHIQFNAWSYLDSNLWAGLVTKIFNGINEYINNYIESEAIRERLKKQLQENLSLSQQSVFKMEEEKITISTHLADLGTKRDKLAGELKEEIGKLQNRSFTEFFGTAVKEFGVEDKIDAALRKNKSAEEVSRYIEKHFPEELWADGKWMKKEISWWKTFFLDFFSKKRLVWNIPIVLAIAAIIYYLPQALNDVVSFFGRTRIELPKQFWAWFAVLGTFSTKAINSYKKVQPLFASLWSVRKKYVEKIEETKHKWQQQEVVILTQIEIDKERLAVLEDGIKSANQDLSTVEFRLLNRLNTEAFQGFVKDKSSAEGYRRHQGIVAMIRDDFSTLSKLFENYSVEREEGNDNGMGDMPLERIVLYIDDLDRCEEARVLEVLEAVHLLMAFNLFVVVVGIDPSRVKSALAEQLRGKGVDVDKRLPSRYLEKIFQVPFHLDQPSDQAVKHMMTKLLTSVKMKEKTVNVILEGEAEKEVVNDFYANLNGRSENPSSSIPHKPNPIPLEKLQMEEEEIKRISDFSVLIGSNPRSVKRFVNILRIVRAHGSTVYVEYVSDLVHSEVIMFLLALSTGTFHPIYKPLTAFLKNGPDSDLLHFFESVDDEELKKCRDSVIEFLKQPEQVGLLKTGMEIFAAHNKLVSRFSFEELAFG